MLCPLPQHTGPVIMWCLMSLVVLMVMTQVSAVSVSRKEITSNGRCQIRSWANWNPCPVSCGLGQQRRARIYQEATNSGQKCMLEAEIQQCYSNPCHTPEDAPCPSPWGAWTDCSVTCGTGSKLRFRNYYRNALGTCFKIPESRPCGQQPCSITPTVRQECKQVEDISSASPSMHMQLFLPEDMSLYRCAHLFYTIIAPTSYGVQLNVSLSSNFRQNSGTTIQVMEQTTASTDTHHVLYKGALNTSQYQTKLNTLLVQIDIKNAPLFFGVTLSCGAYKITIQQQHKVQGCPHSCLQHVQTLLTGTRGVLSLAKRHHHCVIMVWVMKPFPVLPSQLNKGSDLLQQQVLFGSSLSFQFPPGILPQTDYIEVKDGEAVDSLPIYKGHRLPLGLITSGSSARLTIQMCNISLYRNFRISYQQLSQQNAEVELPHMQHPTPIVTAIQTVKPTSEASTTSASPTASLRSVTCSHEQIPKHLQRSPQTNSYSVGSELTVACHKTKTTIGNKMFSCSQPGIWLPRVWPQCVERKPRKRCPDPPLVQNASFRKKAYLVGQRVTYVCKSGYELVGTQTLKCRDRRDVLGQWNNLPPRCEAVTEPCNVTEWSLWSPCSMGCGKGTQHRSRVESLGGNCRAEQQTRPCVTIQPCPAPQVVWPCGWDILIKARGRLSSPGYPHGYLSNQECIWKIRVAAGQEIELLFNEISTEKLFDIVEVRDGGDNNSPLLGEFSGQINNTRIQSTSNKLYIRLLTDGSNEGRGFQAQLQSIGKEKHEPYGADLTALPALQTLSMQPSSLKVADCLWTISTNQHHCCKETAVLHLNITLLDTISKEEVLEIRDGLTKSSPLKGRFSGQGLFPNQKQHIDLHSCQAYIRYWSVPGNAIPSTGRKGFSLTYQATEI